MSQIFRISLITLLLFSYAEQTFAQVLIGETPAEPHSSAVLDLQSTDKGLLIPRISLVSLSSPAPLENHVAGMLVYNTNDDSNVQHGFYYNNGTSWMKVSNNHDASLWHNEGVDTLFLPGLYKTGSFTTFIPSHNKGIQFRTDSVYYSDNDSLKDYSNGLFLKGFSSLGYLWGMTKIGGDGGIELSRTVNAEEPSVMGYIDFSGDTIVDYDIRIAARDFARDSSNLTWKKELRIEKQTSSDAPYLRDVLGQKRHQFDNKFARLLMDSTAAVRFHIKRLASDTDSAGSRKSLFHISNQTGSGNQGSTSYLHLYQARHQDGINWVHTTSRLQRRVNVSNMGFIDFGIPGIENQNNPQNNGLAFGFNETVWGVFRDARMGIGTIAPKAELDVNGIIKIGDNNMLTPEAGMLRYNVETGKFQGFDGTSWIDLH